MDTENKSEAAIDTPTVHPTVNQQQINSVLRTLASRGGRSKSPRKLAALAINRSKRWAGHQKPLA